MKRYPGFQYRMSTTGKQLFLIAVLLTLIISPASSEDKTAQAAKKIIHSGPFSAFGDIVDVIDILTGGDSVKVHDLFDGEKLYACVGDLIQIPITIEFQHENTWDGVDEWIFFEYSIVWDGVEVAWGRLPEEGYFKDENVGRKLKKDLWVGLDKWNCKGDNKHKLDVYGNVYDDAPTAGLSGTYGGNNNKKDSNTSTRQHKQTWGNKSDKKFADTRPLADDEKHLTVITLNPFYGTKPTKISASMEHGEKIGAVHLQRDLHWKPSVQSGKGVFSPSSCDVEIDPIESEPPSWIWKMNLANPVTLNRNSKETVRYNGHHVTPEHPGETVKYTDLNSYEAIGNFYLPPTDKEYSDLLTDLWKDKKWSVIFLYGGLAQDNPCFPAEYSAKCNQKSEVHDPVTTPHTPQTPGDESDSEPGKYKDRYSGESVITQSDEDDDTPSGEKDPWEDGRWTDPPGAFPDPNDPNPFKLKKDSTPNKPVNEAQKNVFFPKNALEGDLITGTVVVDGRNSDKEWSLIFKSIDEETISGLVIVDDKPSAPDGKIEIDSSMKIISLGWLALVGGSDSVVSVIGPESKPVPIGEINIQSRYDVPNPFYTMELEPSDIGVNLSDQKYSFDPTWGEIFSDKEIPPIVKHVPDVIKAGQPVGISGYFPNRVIDNPVIDSEQYIELESIALGPVEISDAGADLIAMQTLASSSIECLVYMYPRTFNRGQSEFTKYFPMEVLCPPTR